MVYISFELIELQQMLSKKKKMPKVDQNIKRVILYLSSKGWTASSISSHLLDVYQVQLSRQSINRFLAYYRLSKSLSRKPGSGRRSKVTLEVKRIVEAKMQSDDENTATQLQQAYKAVGSTFACQL